MLGSGGGYVQAVPHVPTQQPWTVYADPTEQGRLDCIAAENPPW